MFPCFVSSGQRPLSVLFILISLDLGTHILCNESIYEGKQVSKVPSHPPAFRSSKIPPAKSRWLIGANGDRFPGCPVLLCQLIVLAKVLSHFSGNKFFFLVRLFPLPHPVSTSPGETNFHTFCGCTMDPGMEI